MAKYQLPETAFDGVRSAIGLDVDESTLPNSTLEKPVYQGEAERFIMRNFTEAQYENADNLDSIEYIATLYLASLVAPTLRIVSSERITGGNLTYEKTDLSAIAKSLNDRANESLAALLAQLENKPASKIPVVFTTHKKRYKY